MAGMIKNKAILQEIRAKKNQVECTNCKYCNLNAYHSGKWYCSKINTFDIPVINIEECFEMR
jgi:hypothetical protein